jgi:hypothetical protein
VAEGENMTAPIIIQAVKIIISPIPAGLPERTELGLYRDSSVSAELRWSEFPLTGTTQTWKAGILSRGGIGDITAGELDTRRGGNVVAYSGLNLVVLNNNQLILRLKELGVNVNGLTAEIWEFIGTDADSDVTSATLQFSGICEYETGSSWDENLWRIQVKNSRFKRNAFLGTIINNSADVGNYPNATDDMNGKIIPITIGKFAMQGDTPNPAKFIRTAGKKKAFTNSMNKISLSKYCTPEGQSAFPVVSNFCGYTTTGSNNINVWGATLFFTVGDHIKIWSGFSDGADKIINSIDAGAGTITVNGSAANATGITLMDFLHALDGITTACLCYTIKIGLARNGAFPAPTPVLDNMAGFMDSIVGKWLQCIIGGAIDNTSLVGRYRKIAHSQIIDWTIIGGECLVTVQLNSILEKNLSGNVTATATNQAWVSITNIPFEFENDVWPCAGFLDESRNITSNLKKLYVYKSDASFLEKKSYSVDSSGNLVINTSNAPIGFKEIAPYGYNASGSNGNLVIIDAMQFENNPDSLISFDIIPINYLGLYAAATLANWGLPAYSNMDISGATSNAYWASGHLASISAYTKTGNLINAYDKDDSTYVQFYYLFSNGSGVGPDYKIAFEADVNIASLKHEYDGYFFGLNIESHIGAAGDGYINSPFIVAFRKFMGNRTDIINTTTGGKYTDEGTIGGKIKNLPDFYYTARTLDNNRAFFFTPVEIAQMRTLSGYTVFPISLSTIDQLNSILHFGIIFSALSANNLSPIQATIKLFELALICKMSGSISNELYTLCSGRIFNSTWGSRKTAASLINNPVDIIEHWKRLQCGAEFGDTVEFGKAYSPSMLIKTGTGEGGFDSTILTSVKLFTPAYQITDAGDAWTDTQVSALCKTFNLCSYVDNSGYECITTLDKINPSETVAFADILPGSIGETKEPEVQDVYVQPVINYQYNYGSDKYDRQLIILSVQADTYDATYTPGIDNTLYTLDVSHATPDGEWIWNKCHALFLKYRQVEKCPDDFSNQKMIVTYVDAVRLLDKKLDWMGRTRQELAVTYTKGKSYFAGKHIKIKLPHQTANLSVECLIEKSTVSKRRDRVDLRVVLLEDVPTAFFFE